jgi:hypothetical protein
MQLQDTTGQALHITVNGDTFTIYETARNAALDTFTKEEIDGIIEDGYYKQGSNALTINW